MRSARTLRHLFEGARAELSLKRDDKGLAGTAGSRLAAVEAAVLVQAAVARAALRVSSATATAVTEAKESRRVGLLPPHGEGNGQDWIMRHGAVDIGFEVALEVDEVR